MIYKMLVLGGWVAYSILAVYAVQDSVTNGKDLLALMGGLVMVFITRSLYNTEDGLR